MTTKYYIDSTGKYLGGFSEDNPAIPELATEVDFPPTNADDVYHDGAWATSSERLIEQLKAQLKAMEQDAIVSRGIRELILLFSPMWTLQMSVLTTAQKSAIVTIQGQLYSGNPLYKDLKDTDDVATPIRAQIRALL